MRRRRRRKTATSKSAINLESDSIRRRNYYAKL